jgi:UDP-glucuronate 4-epimerase
MRILITGTAGFIGYHLAEKLSDPNTELLGLDNINDYYDVGLKYARLENAGFVKGVIEYGRIINSKKNKNKKFVKADFGDKETILRLFDTFKPEVVVNLAAQAGVRYSLTNPEAYIEANITGFLNILEACRKYPVKHLVYASSSSVYGLNKNMPFDVHKGVNHPVSLYATSKKTNELMAHTYSHLFEIPTTGLRFFTVYGPWGRPDMALFIFTKAILKSESFPVFNHGNMERDFTYIDDIVSGIQKIIDKPASGDSSWNPENPDPSISSAPYRIYNIGNNSPVKLLDFIKAIEKATGKKAIMNMQDIQPGDVEKTWADVNDLMTDFSYKPKTSVEEGIGNFVNWFLKYYNF